MVCGRLTEALSLTVSVPDLDSTSTNPVSLTVSPDCSHMGLSFVVNSSCLLIWSCFSWKRECDFCPLADYSFFVFKACLRMTGFRSREVSRRTVDSLDHHHSALWLPHSLFFWWNVCVDAAGFCPSMVRPAAPGVGWRLDSHWPTQAGTL